MKNTIDITPLHEASQHAHKAVVARLLAAQAAADKADSDGITESQSNFNHSFSGRSVTDWYRPCAPSRR